MKKQLLLLSLLSFALGAMEAPEESNFPSLVQLCVPVVASQFDIEKAKKDFESGNEIGKPNIPTNLQQLVAAQLIKNHSVIPEILSHMSFDHLPLPSIALSKLLKKKQWLQCDAVEHFGNVHVDWFNPDGQFYIHRNVDGYDVAYKAFVYSKDKKLIATLPLGYIFKDIAWSPDSSKVAFLHQGDNSFEIWDVDSGRKMTQSNLETRVGAKKLNWAQDGESIKVELANNDNYFIGLSEFLKKEQTLKTLSSANPDNAKYIERALLLMLAYDQKHQNQKSWFSSSHLDISANQQAKEVFASFDSKVREILTKHFNVNLQKEPESTCLIS